MAESASRPEISIMSSPGVKSDDDVAGLAGPRLGERREDEDVMAFASRHPVGAAAADDRSSALTAVEHIASGAPGEPVVMVAAAQPVVALASVEHIAAEAAVEAIRLRSARQPVIASSALEKVPSDTADQGVVVSAPHQVIVAAPPIEQVAAGPPTSLSLPELPFMVVSLSGGQDFSRCAERSTSSMVTGSGQLSSNEKYAA